MNTSGTLGRIANLSSLLSAAKSPGGIQNLLVQRAAALQDPNVREAMRRSEFTSRALGVGGQTLPVVPGRTTFSPDFPALGAEAQAGQLENQARAKALQQVIPGMTSEQAQTLVGLRGVRAAGFPAGPAVRRGGQEFIQDPSTGELLPIGAAPKPRLGLDELTQAAEAFMGGGGGAPGLRPKRAVTINPVTGDLQLRLETPAEPQPTAKGRLDAALRAGDVVKELEPKYPFGLGAERDWDPSTQAELIGAMRDAGMIAPGQETAVLQALTNDDGSFNREAYDALAVAGRGQRIQSAFEGIP